MGMGSAANSGYMMSVANVASILGQDWKDFIEYLENEGLELEELQYEDEDEERLNKIYELFKEKTTVGNSFLEIELAYYDSEDGDIYDEMEEGCFFWVSGNIKNTDAGEKFKSYMDYGNFVTFG